MQSEQIEPESPEPGAAEQRTDAFETVEAEANPVERREPRPDGQPPIKAIIEAALLAAGSPLSLPRISALFPEQPAVSNEQIGRALAGLAADCADRGVELIEVASGFRYQVRSDIHPWVARLWSERQTRYSRALLETLALIAYRQPITRGEIEQIRGVAVNSQIIKTLEEREWVRVVGHRDVPGKPELLGTTRAFLDYFGLRSLDQLPPLAELRDIGELDPELPFGDRATPVAVAGPEAGTAASDPHDPFEAADSDAASEPPAETGNTPRSGHEPDSHPEPTPRPVETDAASSESQNP